MLKSILLLLVISNYALCHENLKFLDTEVQKNESSDMSTCMSKSASLYPFLQNKFKNCAKAAYSFCCGYGTPCDCNKGTTSEGQCQKEAYIFCCEVGVKCDCSQPDKALKRNDNYKTLFTKVTLLDYVTKSLYEGCLNPEANVSQNKTVSKVANCVSKANKKPKVNLFRQCKKASYAFCCAVGTPCDCNKGTTSPGQCKKEAYLFCCSIGKKCDCSQPGRVEKSISEIQEEATSVVKSCVKSQSEF
jgi:hypothetical protein